MFLGAIREMLAPILISNSYKALKWDFAVL